MDSRPRVVLVHGIFAKEGQSNMRTLITPFAAAGFRVEMFEYGFTGVLGALVRNGEYAKRLARCIEPGDVLVGHSNGCDLIRRTLNRVSSVRGAVYINPALESDAYTSAPWVDVYHNEGDHIVWWSKLIPCHPWGEMGATGYTGSAENHTNIDCGAMPGMPTVNGHLDLFSRENIPHWGHYIARMVKRRVDDA